jgi:anti-sigma B factor antagonist
MTDDSESQPSGAHAADVGCTVANSRVGDVAVVSVVGSVDALSAPLVFEALEGALAEGPAALIADLTDVDFLASSGMSVLIAVNEKVDAGMAFGVVADGPVTGRPLRLVGIGDVLPIYPTLAEALDRYSHA